MFIQLLHTFSYDYFFTHISLSNDQTKEKQQHISSRLTTDKKSYRNKNTSYLSRHIIYLYDVHALLNASNNDPYFYMSRKILSVYYLSFDRGIFVLSPFFCIPFYSFYLSLLSMPYVFVSLALLFVT